MNSEPDWAQAAQQFQQSFGGEWTKAFGSFQALGTGSAPCRRCRS